MKESTVRVFGWLTILCVVGLAIIAGDRMLGAYRHWKSPATTIVPTRYVRLSEWEPSSVRYIRPSEFLGSEPASIRNVDSFVDKEYLLRTDENGFILPSKVHDSPDSSLVFLGGSTTECMFVEENMRFPYLVGRVLDQRTGRKVNSFNGGRSGNTTFNSVVTLLAKVVPMQPDAVIIMENINDLTTLLFARSYWNNTTRGPVVTLEPDNRAWHYYVLKGLKNLFIKYSYNEAWEFIASIREPGDEFQGMRRRIALDDATVSSILKRFRDNLALFAYICRLYNITPVLMTQQNRLTDSPDPAISGIFRTYEAEYGIAYSDFKRLYDGVNEAVRMVGKEQNILVIDLAARIPPTREYLYDIVHFTEKGSIEAASIIATELEKSVLADREATNQ
jgi:lysophospholipase L1-like esterase